MSSPHLLLEREASLAAVERLLAAAESGSGGALFVVGQAGLGKTALLDAAWNSAAGRFRAGRSQAGSPDASFPWAPLREAMTGVDPGAPVPEAAAAGADVRASFFFAALRWLETTAAGGPVLLVLDDVHLADPDSLELFSLICRRLPGLSAAVVASTRPWPRAGLRLARGLTAEGLADLERLRPLGAAAAAQLLRLRAGDIPSQLVERTLTVTAGNPLLLEQAAQVIIEGGDLPAGLAGGQGLLVSRFAGVGDEALALARSASLFGVRFRPGIAAAVAGLGDAATDLALEALAGAGLVEQSEPGRAAFVHPLFRQALYEDIEPPVRARLHARAFRLLHRLGLDTAETAEQALLADLAGDRDAIATLERAGRQALRAGANATAVRHLVAAVRLAGETAPAALHLSLAEAQLVAGDARAAIDECDRLLGAGGLADADLVAGRRQRGRARFYLGDLRGAGIDYEAAVAACRGADADTAADIAMEHASVVLFHDGPAMARGLAASVSGVSSGVSPRVGAAAQVLEALTAVLAGDPTCLDRAREAARTLARGDQRDRAGSLAFFASAAACLECFAESEAAFTTALQWAERDGDPVILAMVASTYAGHLLHWGRPDLAGELSQRAIDIADLAPAARALAQAVAAAALGEQGEGARVLQLSQAAELEAASRGDWVAALWLRLGQLRRDLDDARSAEAAADARWLMERSAALGVREPCLVPWASEALAALVSAADLRGAERCLEGLEEASRTLPCSWPRAVADRGRALMAERSGDLSAAEEFLRRAVGTLAAPEMALERARMLLDLGGLLRRRGQARQARPILTEAVAAAERGGSHRLLAAAVQELRVAGGRRRRRAATADLTAAEARVARLARGGLSNADIGAQLFISTKTVDTHLQHIYAKLGISSRRELIRQGTLSP
ncbi:MAG TPA: AAA family ATPase [Candidatus Binatia bacterium]|nr:AAA family ATPase [Candidatus Binatia bacterium]